MALFREAEVFVHDDELTQVMRMYALREERPAYSPTDIEAMLAARLHWHPVPLVQFANVDPVAVIPHRVTVIVRKRGGRRIVITVDVLDDTVRIVQTNRNVSSSKKTFQFAAV